MAGRQPLESLAQMRLGLGITIACYSAAISSEPGNATGCGRGGIAGRWTKPVAVTQFVACRGTPICYGEATWGFVSRLEKCHQLELNLEEGKLRQSPGMEAKDRWLR
jgi:hypothetical protein